MAKAATGEGQSNWVQTALLSVITLLIGLIVAMVGFYAHGFKEDVAGLRTDVTAIRATMAETKVDLVREISGLGNKLDVLNQKVEDAKPHK